MSCAEAGYGEVLAMEVYDQLHRLELVAAGERGHSPADVERIREEMRRTVAMWRRLLEWHLPADDRRPHSPETGLAGLL
ncbi:MAG TPA: hypothetical protein VGJ13_10515 [Pseudonocardiaceae bacterium]